jgi:DNA processing protein
MIAEHPNQESRKTDSPIRDWHHDGKVLWYEGNIDLLSSLMASVVGTREASSAGVQRTRRLTNTLVQEGFTVVSGLATGIDAVAHQHALNIGGNTIAVMGTPIDLCYPAEHIDLKRSIAQKGLVISQFPPGAPVTRSNFPQRNILMAALSSITFVVEAGPNSGTRHQVKAAVQMGRWVGLLASLADHNFPWVKDALQSGVGVVIHDTESLVALLREIKKIEPSRPFLPTGESGVPEHGKALAERRCGDVVAYWSALISINDKGKAKVIGRADVKTAVVTHQPEPLHFESTPPLPTQLELGELPTPTPDGPEKPHETAIVASDHHKRNRFASLCIRLWNWFGLIRKDPPGR